MYKAFKYKLKPTKLQIHLLNQIGGSTRWLWNFMLNQSTQQYKIDKTFVFKNKMILQLPLLKQKYTFLSDVPSQSLQQKCMDLDKSLKQIHKSKGFPKFKSKKYNNDSFRIPQTNKHIKPTKSQIQLPKIGWIKWKRHTPLQGLLKSVTIKQENNNWYCVCLCQLPDIQPITYTNQDVLGIDVGLTTFATCSDGQIFNTPKFYRSKQVELKRLQRNLSRKQKRSKNRSKCKVLLNKLHNKITCQRSDYLHKISNQITNDYLFIGVEDLNIKGMTKNHNLSKSILDQGWGLFMYQLEYKSIWNGGLTIKIDRYLPSSKTCSNCGHIMAMPLNIREYNCPICGIVMDRDLNASYNIKEWTIDVLENRYGTDLCGDDGIFNLNVTGINETRKDL